MLTEEQTFGPSGESAKATLDYYTQGVTHYRGGSERKYTAHYKDLCPTPDGDMWQAAEAAVAAAAAQGRPITATSLKRVTFVSDGTCFSTCSTIINNPYLRGLASVVTYGGVPGLPAGEMEISSGRGACARVGYLSSGPCADPMQP